MTASRPSWSELEAAYQGRRVLVTGHTGFKGGWLTLWLHSLGANVIGVSLPAPTTPSLFEAAGVHRFCQHRELDIRDLAGLRALVGSLRPDFIFHLAAQSLVRASYEFPIDTISTNVLGTANILEAARVEKLACGIVVVTSDKCYENREGNFGYREEDPLGGYDPYSMSKAAAELVTSSYRRSFFPIERMSEHGTAVASARAGNVVGGGDWAPDRIVPDAIRSLGGGQAIPVRNPFSVRPWQHVLEPLAGYLLLGTRLAAERAGTPGSSYSEAWNFGPGPEGPVSVGQLAEEIVRAWGQGSWEDRSGGPDPYESPTLHLSIDKAVARLGWRPRWRLRETVRRTVDWYKAHHVQGAAFDGAGLCMKQIRNYMEA
ncbi:MAG: CDP-glucose 4,6-dehydratase [Thermoanaerobaculia bacterium]